MSPDKCFGFTLELIDEVTEIVPSVFRPFVGHNQGLFMCMKIFFFFNFVISISF